MRARPRLERLKKYFVRRPGSNTGRTMALRLPQSTEHTMTDLNKYPPHSKWHNWT